jgi:hypothetical protein
LAESHNLFGPERVEKACMARECWVLAWVKILNPYGIKVNKQNPKMGV